ncbi:MAG: hypothetical protein WC869_06635 [Phycisphaerae bacterium]|jgi:hypothetical protein
MKTNEPDGIERAMIEARQDVERIPSVAENVLERITSAAAPAARVFIQPSRWRAFVGNRIVKYAAVFVVTAALVATGWAAEKLYESIQNTTWSKRGPEIKWSVTPPGGKELELHGYDDVEVNGPGDANFSQAQSDTDREQREFEQMIAEKRYKLIKVDSGAEGGPQYFYIFTPPDGEPFCTGFSIPLEQFRSWKDYEKARAKQQAERQAAIQEAIAQGRFKLVNVDVIPAYICKEQPSGEMIWVNKPITTQPEEEKQVYVQPYPLNRKPGEWTKEYQMLWKDHLKAVADGKRQPVDVFVSKYWTYDVTLADGKVVKWSCGVGADESNPLAGKKK